MQRASRVGVSAWLVFLGALAFCVQALAGSEPPASTLRATEFPTSETVIAEYSSRPEQLAALAVLLDLLQFKTDDKSDLALERQSDYRRAIARLDPPRATDHGRVAARQLRRDASFRLAVINEFLPAHANDAARAAAIIQAVPVYETGTVGSWVALVTALTAALAVPIVVLIRGRR